MRVLTGRPLNLSHTFLDDDGETPLTLSGPVTVSLINPLGESVATATASAVGTEWTATLSAQPMGLYFAEWTDGVYTENSHVEVVGGFLFTVPQARNSDDYLTDATAFPAPEIAYYRDVVESEFEDITHRSFTTRVRLREFTADGSGEHLMLCPDAQAIERAWINGTEVADLTDWRISRLGAVSYSGTVDGDFVQVQVRYGFATPPPKVAQAGMVRLRNLMAAETSGIPDRATTWQPEDGGTFRLATPGMGKSETGIPEVDATLARYTLDTVLAVFAGG